MEIDSLRKFVALAGCLNFTAAARSFHISQPALSKSISALERELGARLFTRDNGVALTPAGSYLLERAQSILALHDQAQSECRRISRELGDGLTIALPYATDASYHAMLAACRAIKSRTPYAAVRTAQPGRSPLLKQVADGKVDVGTVILFEADLDSLAGVAGIEDGGEAEGLRLELFHEDSTLVFVQPDSPLANAPSISPESLDGLSAFVTANPPFETYKLTLDDFQRSTGIELRYVSHPAATLEEFVQTGETAADVMLLGSTGLLTKEGHPDLYPRMAPARFDPPLASYIYFVYREGSTNPLLRPFMDEALAEAEAIYASGKG